MDHIMEFYERIKNQNGKLIKILRTDQGREYEGERLATWKKQKALSIKVPIVKPHNRMEFLRGQTELLWTVSAALCTTTTVATNCLITLADI